MRYVDTICKVDSKLLFGSKCPTWFNSKLKDIKPVPRPNYHPNRLRHLKSQGNQLLPVRPHHLSRSFRLIFLFVLSLNKISIILWSWRQNSLCFSLQRPLTIIVVQYCLCTFSRVHFNVGHFCRLIRSKAFREVQQLSRRHYSLATLFFFKFLTLDYCFRFVVVQFFDLDLSTLLRVEHEDKISLFIVFIDPSKFSSVYNSEKVFVSLSGNFFSMHNLRPFVFARYCERRRNSWAIASPPRAPSNVDSRPRKKKVSNRASTRHMINHFFFRWK